MTETYTIESSASAGGSAFRLGNNGRLLLICLVVAALALFARTARYPFISYDDEAYVFGNYQITSGLTIANLRGAMTATINGNWHPLTTLGWLLIASFFGTTSASAFHLVNIVLHALNAALLFWFLVRTTGRAGVSFFAAALWALHPQRVESVAWVSELKDTLCGSMWIAGLLAYLWYNIRPTLGRYSLVALFVILSILAKPIAITLPFVLLLLDYWPLGSIGTPRSWTTRILEKLPLFGITAAGTYVGIHTQIITHSGAPTLLFPFSLRWENAVVSYADYLRDFVWPARLSVFYPHPGMVEGSTISWTAVAVSTALLVGISLLALRFARTNRYLFVGWFWFTGTLVPVIGLVQSGYQARADRFTYLPAMGLSIAIAWLFARPVGAVRRWNYSAVAGICALLLLIAASNNYIGYWRDTPTLFTHVLEVDPKNFLAMGVLGQQAGNQGDLKGAMQFQEQAIQISPHFEGVRLDYAGSLQTAGRLPEAAALLFDILTHDPWSGDGWDALGAVRQLQASEARKNKLPDAEADFRHRAVNNFNHAVEHEPTRVEFGEHLACALAAENKIDDAISVWNNVLAQRPGYAQAQGDLADALLLKGDSNAAVEHYRLALAAGSKNPQWESKLAYMIATDPQYSPAELQPMIPIAKDACEQTHEQDADALDAYAACLARVSVFDLAVESAKKAIVRADAAHDPALSQSIKKRLAKYQQFKPYLIGDDLKPQTQPTSRP